MTLDPLEWSFNPWRDRPLAAAAAVLMTLGMCLVIASLAEPPLVRLILGLAVLGTLSPVLSPYARPHWLDPYRGLLLPIPAQGREGLLDALRGRLEAHGL